MLACFTFRLLCPSFIRFWDSQCHQHPISVTSVFTFIFFFFFFTKFFHLSAIAMIVLCSYNTLQHAGTEQNNILRRATITPDTTRLGPTSWSSTVLKPLSPRPTRVMTRPTATIPSPAYRITFARPEPSECPSWCAWSLPI